MARIGIVQVRFYTESGGFPPGQFIAMMFLLA
jgi:hypothetical protein